MKLLLMTGVFITIMSNYFAFNSDIPIAINSDPMRNYNHVNSLSLLFSFKVLLIGIVAYLTTFYHPRLSTHPALVANTDMGWGYNGHIVNGSLSSIGVYGNYRVSTSYDDTQAYDSWLAADGRLNMSDNRNPRYFGFSIRCSGWENQKHGMENQMD